MHLAHHGVLAGFNIAKPPAPFSATPAAVLSPNGTNKRRPDNMPGRRISAFLCRLLLLQAQGYEMRVKIALCPHHQHQD